MARVSIKNVSSAFMNMKKKEDALKRLQEQMNMVKESQKEQTYVIVDKSTKFILEKTKLGSYLKTIVANTLEIGDSVDYDYKLSLIVEGISKVVEEVSKVGVTEDNVEVISNDTNITEDVEETIEDKNENITNANEEENHSIKIEEEIENINEEEPMEDKDKGSSWTMFGRK